MHAVLDCGRGRCPQIVALRVFSKNLRELSFVKKRDHSLIWKKQRVRIMKSRVEPAYHRLLPCPDSELPVRIEHLFVEKDGNVVEVICEALSLPPLYVNDLIEFGAVYHALRCSKPRDNAPREHTEYYKRACAMNLPRIKGMSVQESEKARRVTSKDDHVEAGSYMRVHVHPRRFPRCYQVDWKSRILADQDEFVVLDKPAGVSVGGSVDNLKESCIAFTTQALNLPSPLLITHHIDNCTEGCVVFAKTNQFVSRFNAQLRTRDVQKRYRVLAAAPVPIGTVTHYMRPDLYCARLVSKDEVKGWHLCVMEIIECAKVPWPSDSLLSKHLVDTSGWQHDGFAYECQVKLLTGRTHQVRAQFAALGAPIIGDTVYTPAAIARLESPEVDPVLHFSTEYWSEEREEKWLLYHGLSAPKLAIGLQASSISWLNGGGDQEQHSTEQFIAGPPWWTTSQEEP